MPGAIGPGAIAMTLNPGPVPVEGKFLYCSGDPGARFRDPSIRITCTDCRFGDTVVEVPRGILRGYRPDEVAEVVDRWPKR